VSENLRQTLQEATERQHAAERGSRLVSLAAAIIAVLAALGALFTHHRAISALSAKNHAILLQARASDTYNRYEAGRVRAQVLEALIDAGSYRDEAARARMESIVEKERAVYARDFTKAQDLETESNVSESRSEEFLKSYELLEVATSTFDISIVLVSISALVRRAPFLTAGCILSAVGVVIVIAGYLRGQ